LRYVFWDIDGTLLVTDRAGIYAWEDAVKDVLGVDVDLSSFDTAGYPDFGIAKRLLTEYGDSSYGGPETVRRLVERYEEHLPGALPRRSGRVLPNVREILTALEREPGIHSMLLTGNTRRGAEAKLSHYGLARFFNGGAFSDDLGERVAIALRAVEQATASTAGGEPGRLFVVGDTPHDIRCAKAIGARTLAVATGSYSVAELAAEGAWRSLPQLPPADEFLALLHHDEVAADA
jgi:phosphoglycolate phosphatase